MTYFFPFICGATLFYVCRFFPFTSFFIASLTFIIMFLKKRACTVVRPTLTCALVSSVLIAAGFFYAMRLYVPEQSIADIAGRTIEISCAADSEAVPLNIQGRPFFAQHVRVERAEASTHRQLNIREMRLMNEYALLPGQSYTVKGAVPKEAYHLNPGNTLALPVIIGQEVSVRGGGHAGFFEAARHSINVVMRDNLSPEAAAFLMSIVTGERGFITKEMKDAFNVTGLAHILSISGAHFGLLLFVIFRAFRFFIRALPYRVLVRLTLYITPSQMAAVLCTPVIIAYFLLASESVPATRSFIMITLFLFGLLIQRKGAWLNTLLFAAALIVIMQPAALKDLSFQLSFLAVLCIGMVTELMKEDRNEEENTETPVPENRGGVMKNAFVYAGSLLYSSALISMAATIGTAPLVAYYFHYFSLVSPLTNLLLTPVIGFVVLPLALLSSFIYLVSGLFPLSTFINSITVIVLEAVKYASHLSFAGITVAAFPPVLLILFYAGLFLFVAMNIQRKKTEGNKWLYMFPVAVALVPIIIYLSLKVLKTDGLCVTHLDVGQGDAAVVEFPDTKTLVIDTGKNGFQVGEFLKYRGISKIDALALSHGQSDHMGGLVYLMENFFVSEVWDNNRLVYPDGFYKATKQRGLQRGDVIEGAGYRVTVLHPYEGFYSLHSYRKDENDDSLVLRVEGKKNSFLFAGDIEDEGEEDLAHLKGRLESNVLKVAHHGSRTSISEAFFQMVSPEIAVISVGRGNSYGHPHRETLDMLSNTRILRTDLDGAIGFREYPDGSLGIRTWRDFGITEASDFKGELKNIKRLFYVW